MMLSKLKFDSHNMTVPN